MTISDLRCDVCGRGVVATATRDPERPTSAHRLFVHPGDPLMRDDSVLVCVTCWREALGRYGEPGRAGICAQCGLEVSYEASLHLLEMTGRIGEAPLWQLCRSHAVEFLNSLRTVDPKLTEADLALKADFGS